MPTTRVRTRPADRAGDRPDDFGDRVYQLALRITGVGTEAEAAVDDALRLAVSTTQRFTAESALESWLRLRVACAAYQRLRRRRHVEPISLDDVLPPVSGADGHFEPIDDWSARIDEQAMQGQLGDIVGAAIDELPVEYRTALILNDADDVSPSDVAEILEIDTSTVRRYVHRARLFVRKRVTEYFAAVEERH